MCLLCLTVETIILFDYVNSGNILGASLNGLDQLIQMPNGCGEQTMLNLAPVVYLLVYFRATECLTAKIESKCKDYMLSGKIRCTFDSLNVAPMFSSFHFHHVHYTFRYAVLSLSTVSYVQFL